jgi:hypothetical protein
MRLLAKYRSSRGGPATGHLREAFWLAVEALRDWKSVVGRGIRHARSNQLPVPIRLYHCTDASAAEAILRDGFRDGCDTYMTDQQFEGVWLSDSPLGPNEGVWGDVLLEIRFKVPPDDLSDFEWIEEGKGYREWLVPAVLLNARAAINIIPMDTDLSPVRRRIRQAKRKILR